jgi:hypothetical protein
MTYMSWISMVLSFLVNGSYYWFYGGLYKKHFTSLLKNIAITKTRYTEGYLHESRYMVGPIEIKMNVFKAQFSIRINHLRCMLYNKINVSIRSFYNRKQKLIYQIIRVKS